MEKTFGEFLKQKRQENNLTQKELAKQLIISESAVSKWEKDVARPDIALLPKLSDLLGVTEHELITSSIDNESRREKAQAKKWRIFSMSWSFFFYISYALALIPCFICDLAINKGLTWFWIVLSALLLAFTLTNLPKYIKKNKLIIIPLSMYLALCLLLGVCCLYTNGNWFIIPALAVLFGLITIFMPIIISKYRVFDKVKKYCDFVSIGIDFILLNILLIVIDIYSVKYNYTSGHWYLNIALPIMLVLYLVLNVLLSVRFLKINKLLKTSVVLFLINIFLYIPPMFVKVNNALIKNEINDVNILKANFSIWKSGLYLDNNIHCIIFLVIMSLALTFLVVGLIRNYRKKK